MGRRLVSARATFPDKDVSFSDISRAEELSGVIGKSDEEDKLMKSVLEGDKDALDEGKLIADSINQGVGSFTPSMIFENIVKNYRIAEQIYGEKIIRLLSGYDASYVEKNVRIPEFQRELKKKIGEKVETLKEKGYINEDNIITDRGLFLAALTVYAEELDNITATASIGEKQTKKASPYGDKGDVVAYKRQRYRDLDVRKTIKEAARRRHSEIDVSDLRVAERKSKGKTFIIYAIDSSSSMKGDKLDVAKKAGVALAYKAIQEKDPVGLIVFGAEIEKAVAPTLDFSQILREITKIRAFNQTDLALTIFKATEMFPDVRATKHLLIITDANPTKGDTPEENAVRAVSLARNRGITVSVIGVKLNKAGEAIAKKLAEIGEGKLYLVRDLEGLDRIVLEDYYSFA